MVCCAGGRKEELAAIQEGTIVASATCDPRQEGKWAVLMAAYAASGANVPATMYIDSVALTPITRRSFMIPTLLINR